MKFVFTDKKVNLPNKVHAYAEKKVGKLDRYFKADAEAAVVFSVEKDRNNVELTVRSGGTIIRVAESTSDMFATVDAAVASVERQLRKTRRAWKNACGRTRLSAVWMWMRSPPSRRKRKRMSSRSYAPSVSPSSSCLRKKRCSR